MRPRCASRGDERRAMVTEGGDTRTMTFQLAGVIKALEFGGKITSRGHRRLGFDCDGADDGP